MEMNYKTKLRKYKIANILGDKFEDVEFIKLYNFFKKYLFLNGYSECIDPDDIKPGDFVYIKNNDIWVELDHSTGKIWLNPLLVIYMSRIIKTGNPIKIVGEIFNTHYNTNFEFIDRIGKYKREYVDSMVEVKPEDRIFYKNI